MNYIILNLNLVFVTFYESSKFEEKLSDLEFRANSDVFFKVTWAEKFNEDFPLKYFVEQCTVIDSDNPSYRLL